jgi:hypothetical protein
MLGRTGEVVGRVHPLHNTCLLLWQMAVQYGTIDARG